MHPDLRIFHGFTTGGDWNKAFFGLWDGAVDDFAAEQVEI